MDIKEDMVKIQLKMNDIPARNLKSLANFYAKKEAIIMRSMMQEIVDKDDIREEFIEYYLFQWRHIRDTEQHIPGTIRGYLIEENLANDFKIALDIQTEKKVTYTGKLGDSLRALICFFHDKEIKSKDPKIKLLNRSFRNFKLNDNYLNIISIKAISNNRAMILIDLEDLDVPTTTT